MEVEGKRGMNPYYGGQVMRELLNRLGFDVAQELKGEMDILGWHPAHTTQTRRAEFLGQIAQLLLDALRKFNRNESPHVE